MAAPAAAGDDEAAAMAAMFKASTENWEQTQEKMSQFVSCLILIHGVHYHQLFSEPFQYTIVPEVLVGEEKISCPVRLSIINLNDLYRLATCAIAVAKKVGDSN
jgi:hypothetical protein